MAATEATWTTAVMGATRFRLKFENPFGVLLGYFWSPDKGKREMYRTYIYSDWLFVVAAAIGRSYSLLLLLLLFYGWGTEDQTGEVGCLCSMLLKHRAGPQLPAESFSGLPSLDNYITLLPVVPGRGGWLVGGFSYSNHRQLQTTSMG